MASIAAMLAFIAALTGCEPGRIEGKVADVRGEALHGVAVSVEGGARQALTNSLGEYSMPFQPGPVALLFSKSGYTPGRLEFPSLTARHVEAALVTLWPLPESKGVYLFENFRYRRAMPQEAQAFDASGQSVYGVARWTDVLTTNPQPTLIAYKLPMQKAALARLSLSEVMSKGSDGERSPIEIWSEAEEIPINIVPIDDPNGESPLIQLQVGGLLREGTYAVHWGALRGDASTEPRLFVFGVVGALSPAPASADETAQPAGS